jgi:hypothetical protein
MTAAIKRSDPKYLQINASSLRETESPLVPDSRSGIAAPSLQPGELDRLYRSLFEVTPEDHPRTARLLASSNRKTAQKVIEEAGEVALEARCITPEASFERSALPPRCAMVSRRHRSIGCMD